MSEVYIVDPDNNRMAKPRQSDEELYFPDLEFKFVTEERRKGAYPAALATIRKFVSFIPNVWFKIASETADVIEIGALWIDFVDQTVLDQEFKRFLEQEVETLNAVTTRNGAKAVFMVQDFTARWEDDEGKVHTSSFIRISPVGFGTSTTSALTYALVDKETRNSNALKPNYPRSLDHQGQMHRHSWTSYISVGLDTHEIKVEQQSDVEEIYRDAEATSTALGSSLLEEFEGNIDLGEVWKDYAKASSLIESIRDAKLREILDNSVAANQDGFRRAKKLGDAYAKAAARSKASRFLSHLSQVISFAASVQNYVEVRDAKADRKELEAKRQKAFSDLDNSLKGLKAGFQKQAQAISDMKSQISETDRVIFTDLVPVDVVSELMVQNNSEFERDHNLDERSGLGGSLDFSYSSEEGFKINSFRFIYRR